jgi:chromate transporter
MKDTPSSSEQAPADTAELRNVSPWTVLWVFLMVGVQSFGGGAATFVLIRKAVVEEHKWLTESEYVRNVTLAQIVPGISLIALSILIGRRVCGVRGIFPAVFGLMFPSVLLTLLVTAFYVRLQRNPLVLAGLRGVVPATVGLGLATSLMMAMALLRESSKEGRSRAAASLLILLSAGFAVARWHAPVILILLVAGAANALLHGFQRPPQASIEEKAP